MDDKTTLVTSVMSECPSRYPAISVFSWSFHMNPLEQYLAWFEREGWKQVLERHDINAAVAVRRRLDERVNPLEEMTEPPSVDTSQMLALNTPQEELLAWTQYIFKKMYISYNLGSPFDYPFDYFDYSYNSFLKDTNTAGPSRTHHRELVYRNICVPEVYVRHQVRIFYLYLLIQI